MSSLRTRTVIVLLHSSVLLEQRVLPYRLSKREPRCEAFTCSRAHVAHATKPLLKSKKPHPTSGHLSPVLHTTALSIWKATSRASNRRLLRKCGDRFDRTQFLSLRHVQG